jgi:ATP-dependent helicase HepA
MIGFIVRHAGLGLGRVAELKKNTVTVEFFSSGERMMLALGNGRPPFTRRVLPLNTECSSVHGKCRITEILMQSDKTEPYRYRVEYETGLADEVSEVDITPVEFAPPNSPLEALCDLQLETGYSTFHKREILVREWQMCVRATQGLRALLSSRIDLRPHQAYVAGTVLMDRRQRYILADEVGLGKTIEAGIVIHDLLEQKPEARILILCPGTLTQQWLCELYAKFSGRVFSMLDLCSGATLSVKVPQKTIASYSAALRHGSQICTVTWDLLVVDEAHNLLKIESLYTLVQELSSAAPACLLLSAMPAQHREEEYLRLLALLEPGRYKPDGLGVKERFRELYARQVELGRKLSYLSRHLGEYAAGKGGADKILKKIHELAELPIFAEDDALKSMASRLASDSPAFVAETRSLLHHVGDRYRISRRILRNRRSQLLEAEPDLNIARRLNRIPYQFEQLELDAANAVRRLLQTLHARAIPDLVLLPLSRALLQSLCDPNALCSFLDLARFEEGVVGDLLEFDGHVSYQAWEEFASALWKAVGLMPSQEELSEVRRAAKLWQAGADQSARLAALIECLRASHRREPSKKLIIFAGFFGLCSRIAKALRLEFGTAAVAEFSWELKDQDKEKEAIRFKRDSQCWLMVSDETGGEGRNFQFVDELIHFDLPWHVSRIEQRIGRLDRLGRCVPEVCSHVVYAEGGEDDGLVSCLEHGFQIFARSISGLEFALSHLERNLILGAIADGYEGLLPLSASILEAAAKERAEDDMQAILDAASLERSSAEVYLRAQSTPERDLALEQAFCEYFKFIGGRGSMRYLVSGQYAEGVLEFRPNQIRDVTLKLPVEANGGVRDRTGTFRREIAQERPDLEFFSAGNEFFDAVFATLYQSASGRTYAVECALPKGQWRGFEFSYRPIGRRDLLRSHPGLIKHLDRIFAVKPEHCFVSDALKLPENQTPFLTFRRGLKPEEQNKIWQNFTLKNERVRLLAERYPNWPDLVADAEAAARAAVRERIAIALSPSIESERKRIEEQIRQARLSHSDDWEQEVAGLEALLEAINGWDLELDIAGFLSVNGGLIP